MEAVARLNNYPTSPRKMRLLADLIRGMEVEKALEVLQYNPKHPATPLYKLLESAINNWKQKNSDERVEDAGLVVKTIMVDGGRVLKRMRPRAQGRGHRILKRSNHVTIIVDSIDNINSQKVNSKKKAVAQPVAEEEVLVKEEEAPKPAKKAAAKKSAAKKTASKKTADSKADSKNDESSETTKNKTE